MVAVLVEERWQGGAWCVGLEDQGVEVRPLLIQGRRYLSERKAVEELLGAWRPSVVHTHGYRPDVLDAPVARKMGIPTVTTVHGFTGGGIRNRIYESLQRRAFREFQAVVAVSSRLAGELAESGVPAARIHLLRNAWAPGLPLLSREAARIELDLDPDEPVVGWIGRLTPEKAPELMVRAFSLLEDPSAVLVMIGNGRMRDTLQDLAAGLGLGDRVRWPGVVPDAFRVMKAFDAFTLSSRTEGTPMVLLEAMAAGTPIVTRAVGGVPELLSVEEAILVHTEEDGAMAEALRTVLSNPGEARARAARARIRSEREFSVGPWVDRYLDVYGSVRP